MLYRSYKDQHNAKMMTSPMRRHSSFTTRSTFPPILVTIPDRGTGFIQIQEDTLHISVIHSDGTIVLPPTAVENPIHSETMITIKKGCTLIFSDVNSSTITWFAIDIIARKTATDILTPPSLDQIVFLKMFLSSVHPIMYPLISKSIVRPGYLQGLYEVFSIAELGLRMDVLPFFREVILYFFQLQSPAVLSALLSPVLINHTIACLEYETTGSELQTTHRTFLYQTQMHRVLDNFHDRIKVYAETNYRIAYLKRIIVSFEPSSLSTIDQIIFQNNLEIMNILLSDKTIFHQIIRAIVPVIIAVNGKCIHSAKPNLEALGFLKELLSLSVPETIMRRMIRKLYSVHLLDLLEHIFISPTAEPTAQLIVLEIFGSLYKVIPNEVNQYILTSDSRMMSKMITHLTDQSPISVCTYRMLEFLLELIPPFNPMETSEADSIGYVSRTYLPRLVSSLFSNHITDTLMIKQRKIADFFRKVLIIRSDLCRDYMNGFITAFQAWINYSMTHNDISAQQKLTRLSTTRLLSYAIQSNDGFFINMALQRSGLIDSIVTLFLLNGSNENMLCSTMYNMIVPMAEKWITSLISRIGNKITSEQKIGALHHILFAISTVLANLGAKWTRVSEKPSITYESIPKNTVNLSRHFAIHRMITCTTTIIQRKQRRAMRYWKEATIKSEPDDFLMDAVYVLAWKQNRCRMQAIKMALRLCVMPVIKRAYMRKPFEQWKAITQKEKEDAIQKHIDCWGNVPSSATSIYSNDSRSSTRSSQFSNSVLPPVYLKRLSTTESIGEEIGACLRNKAKISDDDTFFFIKAIKNDGSYLLSSNDIDIHKSKPFA